MSFEALHSPWSVPEEYRYFYHPEKVKLLDIPQEDRESKLEYRLKYHAKRSLMAKIDDKLRHTIAIYHALTSVVDEQIGRIMVALEKTGFRENTYIIVLADHGDHLGNHRTMGKCLSLEEDLIRVPLIFNNPKKFSSHCSEALVESIDLFPTIMQLAGIDALSGLQGQSLVSLVENKPNAVKKRVAFCEEHFEPYPGHISARNQEFKLIINSEGFEELYNINKDPHEWYNLADEAKYKDVLIELKDEIVKFSFMHVDKALKAKENWVEEFMKPGFHRY